MILKSRNVYDTFVLSFSQFLMDHEEKRRNSEEIFSTAPDCFFKAGRYLWAFVGDFIVTSSITLEADRVPAERRLNFVAKESS